MLQETFSAMVSYLNIFIVLPNINNMDEMMVFSSVESKDDHEWH